MRKTTRRLAIVSGIALAFAGAGLAPALVATADDDRARPSRPRTVHVTGEQIPIAGTPHFKMTGDLVGDWFYYPQKKPLHDVPSLYSEAGTEVFVGCFDRDHDGKCGGWRDRGGEMRTVFLYWASFETAGKTRTDLIKGQCVHPITGGRGVFRGSRGVIDMVDRLEDGVVKTSYSGDIELNAVPSEPPAPPAAAGVASTAPKAAAAPAERTGC